jgi:hypothetical protein
MRDNLLLFNIEESTEEETEENPEEVVLSFFEERLQVKEAKTNIKIERAHRIGRKQDKRTRPIVVKFSFYKDREMIRKKGILLKGTNYGIGEQFPREIQDRRKKLIPHLKSAKAKGQKANLVADKLYINNKLFKLPDEGSQTE